jgi:hypothetical protein
LTTVRHAALASLGFGFGCLPAAFDALAEAAPVQTQQVQFPGEPDAAISVALTLPGSGDADGRGWVLFGDGDSALGWVRLGADERIELRFATFAELTTLAARDQPLFTGLAVNPNVDLAEGLVRVAGTVDDPDDPDRIVRFGLADFTRAHPIEDDIHVYAWVGAAAPLGGALAAVELDEGLPEVLSASSEGLFIWDSLGTHAQAYAQARGLLLADDPAAFDADPAQGWGLSWCPQLHPTALAGGRVGAGQGRAALALEGETLTFIGPADPPQLSAVGAPIYDCARASLDLPGPGSTLAVVDLGLDDDDDLLVGSPASGAVWVYENDGDGVPDLPSMTLTLPESDEDLDANFGASLAVVDLGGDGSQVIAVGGPGTRIAGKADVGRIYVFDGEAGGLLRTIEDLDPRAGSRHGLAVHGLDLSGRQELVVTGARELRVHWSIMSGDVGPTSE